MSNGRRQNGFQTNNVGASPPMKATRRSFLITSIGAVSALALSREALADAPMLSETDPTAAALGYKADATKVDKTKYPKYAAGQDCAACM
ncbi:high-potential iron-sulfur protein, partial [Burkholderia cenocepacia]|uniref:high-potential iron-sulfur protein n=1 Tax=Burkholderia cenocepacia TaxID=95486 RepID=UPI0030F455E4